ncbi:hypothetical protein GF324_05945 [bacterium]|nr:hypothetical protein [bacterium]
MSAFLDTRLMPRLAVRAGYRFHRRLEFILENNPEGDATRRLHRSYETRGPVVRLTSTPASPVQFRVEGSLLTVDDSNRDALYRLETYSMAIVYRW